MGLSLDREKWLDKERLEKEIESQGILRVWGRSKIFDKGELVGQGKGGKGKWKVPEIFYRRKWRTVKDGEEILFPDSQISFFDYLKP